MLETSPALLCSILFLHCCRRSTAGPGLGLLVVDVVTSDFKDYIFPFVSEEVEFLVRYRWSRFLFKQKSRGEDEISCSRWKVLLSGGQNETPGRRDDGLRGGAPRRSPDDQSQ